MDSSRKAIMTPDMLYLIRLFFQLSEYGLKPKGDYDTVVDCFFHCLVSLCPNMDSSRKAIMTTAWALMIWLTRFRASEYGLKPKGDYDRLSKLAY